MAVIRVSPDEMDAAAQAMTAKIENWDSQVNVVRNCVTQLDSMWEGLGNDTFRAIWDQNSNQFNQLRQLMEQYRSAIQQAAARFRAADQNVSNIVR